VKNKLEIIIISVGYNQWHYLCLNLEESA